MNSQTHECFHAYVLCVHTLSLAGADFTGVSPALTWHRRTAAFTFGGVLRLWSLAAPILKLGIAVVHTDIWGLEHRQGRKVVNNQGESEENNEEEWQRERVRLKKQGKWPYLFFFLAKVKWESPHYSHVCPLNVKLQLEADWCRFISVHMGKHTGQYWHIYDTMKIYWMQVNGRPKWQ